MIILLSNGRRKAFSHLVLIGTALNLHDIGPAQQRGH